MTETPDTGDFSFERTDVEGLITVLSKTAPELTKGQWGLLVSLFALAAGNVKVDDNDTSKGTFPGVKVDGEAISAAKNKEVDELRKQLRNAHMPGREPGAPLGDMIVPPPPNTPGG
jgi:hypothetical protein